MQKMFEHLFFVISKGNDDVALEDADEENSLIGDGIIEEEGKNGINSF